MRYYKGPLPAELRQYRERIVAMVRREGALVPMVHCMRYGCHEQLTLAEQLAGQPTCKNCGFFRLDGHLNVDARVQAYAAQAVKVEWRSYSGARRLVWWYRCATEGCSEVMHENSCRKRKGYCWPCTRKENTVYGVYTRKFADLLRSGKVLSAHVTSGGRTVFRIRCNTKRCLSEGNVYNASQLETWRCKRCALRGEPFGHWYYRAGVDAKKRSIPFELTLAEYQTFSRAQNCFYCHTDLRRQPFLAYDAPKAPGWAAHCMDRLDPEVGYRVENIIPCCGRCNLRRGRHLSVQDALALGRAATYGMEAASKVLAAPASKVWELVARWQKAVLAAGPKSLPPGLSMERPFSG